MFVYSVRDSTQVRGVRFADGGRNFQTGARFTVAAVSE